MRKYVKGLNMNSFWEEEFKSMQGIDHDKIEESLYDIDLCQEKDDTKSCQDICPRCDGQGCKSCLRVEYEEGYGAN